MMTKTDRFLQMMRVWVERDGGDMDAALAWMYSDKAEPTDEQLTALSLSIPFGDDISETSGVEWRRKFARAAIGLAGQQFSQVSEQSERPAEGELLRALGKYALRKGETWRTGEGAEIMDAYEALLTKVFQEKNNGPRH
jgi:hypothetical protein